MTWQITEQDALFAIAILVFGLIGYQRGWRREIVSLLFILLALGFLFLHGGVYVAQLLYQFLFDRQLTDSHSRFAQIITIIAVVVIIGLGYLIGGRRFPKPASPEDRTLGFFLGAFTGVLVAAYVTIYLLRDTQTKVITRVTTISSLSIGPYLIANFTAVLIFLIALVVVIVGLVAAMTKKK